MGKGSYRLLLHIECGITIKKLFCKGITGVKGEGRRIKFLSDPN